MKPKPNPALDQHLANMEQQNRAVCETARACPITAPAPAEQPAPRYGFLAFWRGHICEIFAENLYRAQRAAAQKFRARAHEITVMLAEKDGKQVTHVADF